MQVTGCPDAIWRNPTTGQWCVVEYKLGRTSPEADAAQACLYHMMLRRAGWLPAHGGGCDGGDFSFLPARQEGFSTPAGWRGAAGIEGFDGAAGRRAAGQTQAGSGCLLPGCHPRSQEHKALGRKLVQALEQYGAVVELRGSPIVGPAFLRYTIMPGKGVKVASIINKAEDLQIRLGLEHAPLIQKAGGKLVIDVQRPDRKPVLFSSVIRAVADAGARGEVLLGVDLFGEVAFRGFDPDAAPAGGGHFGQREDGMAAVGRGRRDVYEHAQDAAAGADRSQAHGFRRPEELAVPAGCGTRWCIRRSTPWRKCWTG